MTEKRLKLGYHMQWRVGDPLPPLEFVLRFVSKLGPERGEHWLLHERKGVRWHQGGTYHALLKWKGHVYNVARVIIAHTAHGGAQPPFYMNACGASECVNPVHWQRVRAKGEALSYALEARDDRIVVTKGGRIINRDTVVRAVKPGGPVHIVRVLADDYQQRAVAVCGAPLDLEHLVVQDDATCTACTT